MTEVAIPVARVPSNQAPGQGTNTGTETNPAGAEPLSGLPNSSPLNMFPQVNAALFCSSCLEELCCFFMLIHQINFLDDETVMFLFRHIH